MKGIILDGFNFTGKLTGKRVINAIKAYYSFKKAAITKYPKIENLPLSISIEPTTSCNLRCPECPSGLRSFSRPTGMMRLATMSRILEDLHEYLMYLTMYFQGEPYLHPKFLNMIRYANSKGIYTATSTNAHFLTKETAIETVKSGLDRIIISMDGTSQDTYEKYRIGGNLDKVMAGIDHLVAAREEFKMSTPHIILQFVLFQHNLHQIQNAKIFGQAHGVDRVEFKTAQIYDFTRGATLIPRQPEYSRYYLNGDTRYSIKSELPNKCWRMWHSCVMTWDGNIVPCCFDKDAKYTMGNIHEQSFEEIWKGPKYQDFRTRLFKNRKEIDICKNCTEGLHI